MPILSWAYVGDHNPGLCPKIIIPLQLFLAPLVNHASPSCRKPTHVIFHSTTPANISTRFSRAALLDPLIFADFDGSRDGDEGVCFHGQEQKNSDHLVAGVYCPHCSQPMGVYYGNHLAPKALL
jgi:hypothetical protein